MPPAYTGVKLSPKEIETITNWIAQGAKWQKHWSFLPPKHYPAPPVKDAAWVRNPIDAFVLARLEEQNLHPSPEADRETLIRRVTLDLTGLPPTPAEIDAFLNDKSDQRLRKSCGPPARLAALRRAHGLRLARRRPLRRYQRLSI